MSVLIDDSTTVQQMLPHLAELAPLTVATNYLSALSALAKVRDLHVVALGGIPGAFSWIDDRFTGKPLPPGCGGGR